ncbi:MAG TPA: DUF255 domain-containing protein [Phycisphaerales bacterium]|nr:DUF255 domain-containing protein [Phycisphaerales bacterium]
MALLRDRRMQNVTMVGVLLFSMTAAAPAWTVDLLNYQDQHSAITITLDEQEDRPVLTARFQGTDDLHYYARSETAPAPGLELKLAAEAEGVAFGSAVFPPWELFYDKGLEKNIEVYMGDFEVRIPITSELPDAPFTTQVTIEGIACTSEICLPPFAKTLAVRVSPAEGTVSLVEEGTPSPPGPGTSASETPGATEDAADLDNQALAGLLADWNESSLGRTDRTAAFYFVLAILAGLSINIMPCVLPVLPLIIMRLVAQGRESSGRRLVLGGAFCLGIVGFFAAFAALAVVIRMTTGAVIDINDLFRTPAAVIALFLLIVFFALVFLDVITITLPASLAGGQPERPGLAGSIGMGFFAGLLSTPCSGALLGAVLVWAQTQPPAVGAVAIILMGVGMALPYAVLVAVPAWLNRLPKPGAWMDILKKTGGFLLLAIAVKFALSGLDKDRLINVLLFAVIFGFCLWIWGGWVSYATPSRRKWTIRLIAVLLAVACGFWLLPSAPASKVPWQPYGRAAIAQALEDGRGVVIKFTADWCTNCKVVDKRVYHDPAVVRLIERKNLLAIEADTTRRGWPATVDLDAIFGEAGNVPVTVLLEPRSKVYTKLRGIFSPERFIEAAEALP